MRLLDSLTCAVIGHAKWTPPDVDPDEYKVFFIDYHNNKHRISFNLCARCGQFYGTARHLPDMPIPTDMPIPWPEREDTRKA